ncbi:GTP-binding protein [Planotetraspora thailandica]|uniref:elongation factor G n=1 Tax=Planotetraspora thailandica TaxID=487172 RepID=UPI001EF17EBF|nr:TetM/TetW/TetO/TetS family tetracycline resistance ribosomal protection protein [Planotetraspora thailandica]
MAHVDAGKTSLTERLLHTAGVIDEIGSVDDGNTQTDSLALERRRGITIKSAVVSFAVGGVSVNLIDTPGHPDFIAEVERVLTVLDGAVLVVSAVEGVQAQTRVLMRTLRRLRIPTLIFVNKIDRGGARDLSDELAEKLTPAVVAMGVPQDLGTRQAGFLPYGPADAGFTAALAEMLAERDDTILAAYVDGGAALPYGRLRAALAVQTGQAVVHPVFYGSAITGAGVDGLIRGLAGLLPASEGDADGPVSGAVFKVERGRAGEKIAYVRMFSGTVTARDRVRVHRPGEPAGEAGQKVTAVEAFEYGTATGGVSVVAGQIGKLGGLADVRIGDAIGMPRDERDRHHFDPPTLETAVVPRRPGDKGRLRVALGHLAEQDPLINLRQDDTRQELFLSLYGEVQKEVIQETLASDFGLGVEFRETTTICLERPVGTAEAVETLNRGDNPFLATVGLRIEPAIPGSGVTFELDVKVESMPLHIYKTVEEFRKAIEETVRRTLSQGLYGWQVTDCVVTLTDSGYVSPETMARDFRLLTPLVLMSALKRAGTVVCEPIHRYHLEARADTARLILPVLARLGALPRSQMTQGSELSLGGEIPVARVHELQEQLRALTHGEGVLEVAFDHHAPVHGRAPSRPRTDGNPLNRQEYLLHIRRRV